MLPESEHQTDQDGTQAVNSVAPRETDTQQAMADAAATFCATETQRAEAPAGQAERELTWKDSERHGKAAKEAEAEAEAGEGSVVAAAAPAGYKELREKGIECCCFAPTALPPVPASASLYHPFFVGLCPPVCLFECVSLGLHMGVFLCLCVFLSVPLSVLLCVSLLLSSCLAQVVSSLWGIDDSGSLLPIHTVAGAQSTGLQRHTESDRERRESMELEAALAESRLMMVSMEAGQQLEEERSRDGARKESTEGEQRERSKKASAQRETAVEAVSTDSSAIVLE